MGDLVFGVVLAVSLGIGTTAVYLTHRLQRRYRLDHLSTYLYFQVFITAFGVYGVVGRVLVREALGRRGTGPETIETIGHFFAFLGLPFLILAWYMFLRLSREMVDKDLPRRLTLAYFSVWGGAFLAYGVFLVWANVSAWSASQLRDFASGFTWLSAVLVAATLVSGVSRLFRRASLIEDEKRRQAIRRFGLACLLAYSAVLVLSPYILGRGSLAVAYMLAFFSANLIPLLYWRAHLLKAGPAASLLRTPAGDMTRFIEEFKISKREEEVIRELCAGKTNKEIAETLFISLQTVKDHIYRIYLKTNVNNRVQLINLIQGRGSRDGGSATGTRD